ncbi:MAG: 4Fe-4S dicluster domain-containing protein [Gemmatimonadales bacterium]
MAFDRRKHGKEPFTPSPEQQALWPEISGNTINGLGEPAVRRPSPIYWHDPALTPHGPLQVWMMEQGIKEPALHARRAARAEVIATPPVPVASARVERPPQDWVREVKELAFGFGADLVGIVRTDPLWVYEGYDFDYPWIVMLGVRMDYEMLETAPEVTAALAVVDGYTGGWKVAKPLADRIREAGWRAEPRGGPPAGPVALVPAALACGFGELGKHGSIINRALGSNFRLAAVFTDLPLAADDPAEFGAEDFCVSCQACVNACPADAISHEKRLVRGVMKWYVDFDRCLPYFNETFGCAVCLAACPWSIPGTAPRLADKMLARRARREES